MSAGGSGAPAEGAVDANVILAIGIIGGLLGIYLSGINPVIGPVLSCLGAVCAILWGVIAIRSVASYGLGTGVPSIGYMSLGIGVIGALAGVGIIASLKLTGLEIAGPILALIFAMIIGLLVAIVAKKIVGMKIPVMERCTAEIAGAAALSVLGFSAAIAGGYSIDLLLSAVIAPGFIAIFYILCTMAIQHPFNACLGPNEDQVCEAAASVKWAGLWPKVEE